MIALQTDDIRVESTIADIGKADAPFDFQILTGPSPAKARAARVGSQLQSGLDRRPFLRPDAPANIADQGALRQRPATENPVADHGVFDANARPPF